MRSAFLLILFLLWSSGVFAGPFTLYVSGEIDDNVPFIPVQAGLKAGDRYDFALSLDPSAVTDSFASTIAPDAVKYFGGITGLSGTLAGVDLTLGPPLEPGLFNSAEIGFSRDPSPTGPGHIIQFLPTLSGTFGGVSLTRLIIGFQDRDAALLDSLDFTSDPFTTDFLDQLEQARVQFQFTAGGIESRPGGAPDYVGLSPRSQAQAQVPAPGTLLLVMAGFLASSRRRLGTLLCIFVSPKVCEPKHAVGIHV